MHTALVPMVQMLLHCSVWFVDSPSASFPNSSATRRAGGRAAPAAGVAGVLGDGGMKGDSSPEGVVGLVCIGGPGVQMGAPKLGRKAILG